MKRTIAFYKSALLPKSETFLRSQAESLSRYQAFYLGLTDSNGLELTPSRTFILGSQKPFGRAEVSIFKATGRSPRLTAQLQRRQTELIHAHFGTEAWRAMQLGKPLGLPTIVTFHGADATTVDAYLRKTGPSARQYIRNRRSIFEDAGRIVAVSQYIAEKLISSGCPPKNITVLPIGVDFNWFYPAVARLRRPDILFVGRLVEKKGLLQLFDAIEIAQRNDDNFPTLTVAGDGPQRGELEKVAQKLRIRVSFLGFQSHTEVRTLMQTTAALVVPSHEAPTGESEGLPTVIREAQACGLPVVVTRTAGASEAVQDGVNGLLVPPRDPISLARAISRLIGDQELQERLRSEGFRAAASVDYSIQTTKLEALYDEVLAVERF